MIDRRCPGCNGKISARAQLCVTCRRKANAIGAEVVQHVGAGHVAAASTSGPRTAGQSRAYHGKCGTLARLRGVPPQEIKRVTLEQASRLFERSIESSKAMNEDEMSDVLDLLDAAIAEASQVDG